MVEFVEIILCVNLVNIKEDMVYGLEIESVIVVED